MWDRHVPVSSVRMVDVCGLLCVFPVKYPTALPVLRMASGEGGRFMSEQARPVPTATDR